MATFHEQRSAYVRENTALILRWLTALDERGKADVIHSLVNHFSLVELGVMNTHVKEELGTIQATSGIEGLVRTAVDESLPEDTEHGPTQT